MRALRSLTYLYNAIVMLPPCSEGTTLEVSSPQPIKGVPLTRLSMHCQFSAHAATRNDLTTRPVALAV